MMWQPTISAERWLTLARHMRRSPASAPFDEHTDGWRTANWPSRCLSFVLGLIAAGMIGIIVARVGPRDSLVLPGLVSLLAAEWLIIRRRHFASGIEEALEVAGLFMLASAAARWLGNSESAEACMLGCVMTIAGLRLLNPLFTTVAVLAFVTALSGAALSHGLVCYGVGLAALAAGALKFRRPSHDAMLDFLVLVMPVAGYLTSASAHTLMSPADYRHASFATWLVPVCSIMFAVVALAVGVRRRTHAPLAAFALSAACTAYELRAITGLSLEARLLVWGSILLFVTIVLERRLRAGTRGITSRPLQEQDDATGTLGVAGSAILIPSVPAPKGAFRGGGGGFGGGGAGGQY